MTTPKKLMKLVQKWASKRKDCEGYKGGHFVVYASDNIRFVMPLRYLNNTVFSELLRVSEDEFGLPRDGPITLPCDSTVVKYLVSVFERGFPDDFERVLLAFVVGDRCSCVCETY